MGLALTVPDDAGGMFRYPPGGMFPLCSELGYVLCKLALEVGCLVLRDSFLGCETVKHSTYFAEFCLSLSLVGHFAKIAHCIAGSLGIVAVAEAT